MLEAIENIEYSEKNLKDYLLLLRRRKYHVAIVGSVVLFIMLAIAFGLPSLYRSSSTILIEQQEIPQDLVRSTVTSYADQRIQIISQRVMTSSNLSGIVDKFNLYPKRREKDPREVIVERMRSDIGMQTISADVVDPRSGRPTQATIAFTLYFESRYPDIAQKVTSELTSLFLNENLKTRAQMAAETSGFLTEEAEKLEGQIAVLETQLADFKEQNINSLPELVNLNLSLMDKVERDLLEVERQIQVLQERKIYLGSELAQLNPSSTVLSESGERILSPAGRLKVLEAEYLRAAANYSPDHPDIIKLKKEISALEQEVGQDFDTDELRKQISGLNAELTRTKERYSEEHPDVVRLQKSIAELERRFKEKLLASQNNRSASKAPEADNPAYIQLQAQLDATTGELSSLLSKRNELKTKLNDFEKRLVETPQIERQYKALTRDYQNAELKYREIKAKQMEALLAESLELERKGERFTLIEPPLLPEKPIKPNRKAILVIGIMFAIAAGIGIAFLLDIVDGNVHGRKAVINLLGQPPLAVIPYIQTETELKNKIRLLKIALIGCAVSVVVAAILFHIIIMPLDTFWFVMLRRLGI